ncbi:MAG: serine/threonine protein kinase, partial [Planctomycetes bacterium]|nr:serine/threonine protein kinase [Planctomycetota bacterium]
MKIVCGRCAAEVELPKQGEGPQIRCPSCAAVFLLPSLAEGEELARPDTFPGYRVVALVGHGGMGAVYRAIQLSMEREVAIKVLLRKYVNVPRFVARFERESDALAALSHPNIVGVIDRGRVGDIYYFVMEYVHGRTLRNLVKGGQVGVARAVDVALQICQALEAAHAAGVVHRDIKPGNILVGEGTDQVKVADFGIAHIVEEDATVQRERRSRLGTAKYMAPEQRGTGEVVDARADIYALGVSLHEMLTGELPTGQPPSAANPLAPKELDAVVERATRARREERFQSAAEMRQALLAAREAVRREETSVTEAVPAGVAAGPVCHACGLAVGPADLSCAACATALVEPCFRPDCEGVNRVGAERCAACGGHIKLIERQRRAELEEFLALAEAEIASARVVEAAELLAEVQAEPHGVFAGLRERAQELQQRLLLLRPPPSRGSFVFVAAAVAAAGLALLVYWRITEGLASRPPDHIATTVKADTTKRITTPIPLPTAVPVPPQPLPASNALRDYLLAVTDDGWPKLAPELRLAVAADAAAVLAAAKGNGQASKRLLRTLADLGKAEAPLPETARSRAAAALDALCEAFGRELARNKALAPQVRPILTRYAAAARAATDHVQKLDLAAAALYDLLAAAEAAQNPKPDLPTRLILLEGSLGAPARADL